MPPSPTLPKRAFDYNRSVLSKQMEPPIQPSLFNDLRIISMGKDIWHCDQGDRTYRITRRYGQLSCTCTRPHCPHIQHLMNSPTYQPRVSTAPSEPHPLEAKVQQLEAELHHLRREVAQVMQLGFVNNRQFVFIDQRYGGIWYTLDRDNNPTQIQADRLVGYLRNLEIKPAKREGQYTLLVDVDADRRYVLRTGHQTHFAKGMLAAIAVMTPEQLRRPVIIQPQKSKETTFCNLHQDEQLIRARYTQDTDFKAIAQRAFQNLATVVENR